MSSQSYGEDESGARRLDCQGLSPARRPAGRPRHSATATVAGGVPITRTDPLGYDAAEANWENEGGRLLRAIRLDQNAAQRGVPSAEPDVATATSGRSPRVPQRTEQG